ncbi:MAG: hypothetical protein DRP66_00690 [Planctomycetota bacterium]|nr:MAG: hypothetical protein DRP66_00690 [Planctomycetota bacterium]
MAEIDHNIKPVESLHNIGGVTPAKRRRERRKRQNLNEQDQERPRLDEDQLNESVEENADREIAEKDQNDHSIDYCA